MNGPLDISLVYRLRLLRELCFVLTASGAVYALGYVLHSPGLGLLSIVAAWILISWRLRCRNSQWRMFGWHRSQNWKRTLALVIFAVMVLHGLVHLLKPWIADLTGQPLDISLFSGLKGNIAALAGGLLIVWTVAAFGEEMVFRGYVLNRVAKLFSSSKTGWLAGVLVSSIIFGLGHLYQGWSGVILATLAGGVYCGAYFLDRRCLWAPILIHGVYDTSAFLILFFS